MLFYSIYNQIRLKGLNEASKFLHDTSIVDFAYGMIHVFMTILEYF